ncbi:MAG: methyltransferase domain-containing protein [Candidatus Hodarchaeota archaeon]
MPRIIWSNFISQLDLPFLETSPDLLKAIFQILKDRFGLIKNSNQKLIDLGAGVATVIIYSALNYGIKSFGIEINPNLIKEAKKKIEILKVKYKKKIAKNIKIELTDLYQKNLKKFDFIYIYSFPKMQKNLKHVFSTAKKDAIVISHKYPLEGLNSYLKHEYELKQKKGNKEVSTYFYIRL